MVQHTTPEVRARMVALYDDGFTYGAIAAEVGFSTFTVRKAVEAAGRPRRYAPRPVGSVWHEAFDVLTPEARYWAGWLITDGNVSDSHRVKLALEKEDEDAVAGLRAFVRATNPVTYYDEVAEIRFTSPYMAQRLRQLGVTPRKTFSAEAHEELCKDVDFWRGCIDGDGMLRSKGTTPVLGFTNASVALQTQARAFFAPYYSDPSRSFKTRDGKLYELRLNGTDAVNAVNALYYPGCLTTRSGRAAADAIINFPFKRPEVRERAGMEPL